MELFSNLNGWPIVITTRRHQNRKHRKKRINKKWLKRYGYEDYELQTDDVIIDRYNKKIYIKLSIYEKMLKERKEK